MFQKRAFCLHPHFLTISLGIFWIAIAAFSALFLLPLQTRAQDADIQCVTPEQKASCLNQLNALEADIANVSSQLSSKKAEGSSLQRDKDVLDLQIKQAKLKIKAKELSIAQLGKDITVKTNTINALSNRIDLNTASLQQILQRTNELDNFSPAEVLLSNTNISEFFIDVDSFSAIRASIQDLLDQIRNDKSSTEDERQNLNDRRAKEMDLKASIEGEKKKVEVAEAEKKRLLNLNAAEQKNYQGVLADKQSRATKIRNALFALRDSPSIKFGDAVVYAKAASSKTGVRPAFVLAIIQQESNLGVNVGSCYLTSEDGSGIKVKSGTPVSNLMKASRDVAPFLRITKALGRDPFKTLVSCPIGGSGYGGAMGPAQFIPSTWAINENRIAQDLGKSFADPWNPADAIMASSVYLSDLGASAGGYTAERNAACRYYSGRNCTSSTAFYGNQVMGRVETIQQNIDILGS